MGTHLPGPVIINSHMGLHTIEERKGLPSVENCPSELVQICLYIIFYIKELSTVWQCRMVFQWLDIPRSISYLNLGPFHYEGLILIPTYISITCLVVLDEITFPFPNFNGATVEVWEWISNFIQHFVMGVIVINYPCWDPSWSMLVKGDPGDISFNHNLDISLKCNFKCVVFIPI